LKSVAKRHPTGPLCHISATNGSSRFLPPITANTGFSGEIAAKIASALAFLQQLLH
jgi:hypothetical protein